MKKVGFTYYLIGLSYRCGPTPQAELEQNSQENIYTYTKPSIDELYKKILNEKERMRKP